MPLSINFCFLYAVIDEFIIYTEWEKNAIKTKHRLGELFGMQWW
ncbi:hypothetical protein O9992_00305 [Vibrio lentus]|nr:hypothetical protein [Vibrio lentus]